MSEQDARDHSLLTDSFSETPKKITSFSHLWTIENISFHPKDKKIVSPPFNAATNDGVQWKLIVYPDGGDGEDKGFISTYLELISCRAKAVCARFHIAILNANHVRQANFGRSAEPQTMRVRDGGMGWGQMIQRSDALKEEKFPGGKLIFRTEISYAIQTEPNVPGHSAAPLPEMPEFNPSVNFGQLLESGAFSDVVFVVDGKEFRAHKAILASRSPTFRAMLRRSPASENTTRLEIHDTDEETFSELLRLIYTGRTVESHQRIQKLITAIASQTQASLKRNSSDEENEAKTKAATSTCSTVSLLKSIGALIVSHKSLEADPSPVGSDLKDEWKMTVGRSHLGIELTPSAALAGVAALISASGLRPPEEKTSRVEFPEEASTGTGPVASEAHPENLDASPPLQEKKNGWMDRLRDSNVELAKRLSPYTPVVGVKKFHGDQSAFFEWWREFKAQVHGRRDLSIGQKLVDLLSLLEGEAIQCINDSSFEALMYFATLDSLFLRYSNIESLRPGLFALLLVRWRKRLTLPLRITDNRRLMEEIEKLHRCAEAPQTDGSAQGSGPKVQKDEDTADADRIKALSISAMDGSGNSDEEDGFRQPASGCLCLATSSIEMNEDAFVPSCCCDVSMGKQLQALEDLFAETPSPDSDKQERLAKKIGLTKATVRLWFRLRPIDWRARLLTHSYLAELDAFRGCHIQTSAIDSGSTDSDEDETPPSSPASVKSSSPSSTFDLV